jgi:hypothetical protein
VAASFATERTTQRQSADLRLRFTNAELGTLDSSDTIWSLHDPSIHAKFVSAKDKGNHRRVEAAHNILMSEFDKTERRPIIFLVYSLGGILVKSVGYIVYKPRLIVQVLPRL